MKPRMKCGHTANATDSEGRPVCVICSLMSTVGKDGDPGREIDESPPDVSQRQVRCAYANRTGKCPPSKTGGSCGFGCKNGSPQPSDPELPFFAHKPDSEFDEFYCGCLGWD